MVEQLGAPRRPLGQGRTAVGPLATLGGAVASALAICAFGWGCGRGADVGGLLAASAGACASRRGGSAFAAAIGRAVCPKLAYSSAPIHPNSHPNTHPNTHRRGPKPPAQCNGLAGACAAQPLVACGAAGPGGAWPAFVVHAAHAAGCRAKPPPQPRRIGAGQPSGGAAFFGTMGGLGERLGRPQPGRSILRDRPNRRAGSGRTRGGADRWGAALLAAAR